MKPHVSTIKRGQVYHSRKSNLQVEVIGQKKGKWLTRVLTDKPGVYKGSHTLSALSIRNKFALIS